MRRTFAATLETEKACLQPLSDYTIERCEKDYVSFQDVLPFLSDIYAKLGLSSHTEVVRSRKLLKNAKSL